MKGDKTEITSGLLKLMKLPRRFWSVKWDEIDEGGPKKDVAAYFKKRFPDRASSDGDGLMFMGKRGCGKSMLSAFVAKVFAGYGHTVLWIRADQFQDQCFHNVEIEDEESWSGRAKSVDVLFVDDLGREAGARSYALDVLLYRRDEGKTCFVNTALNVAGIDAKYGDGVSTSLADMMSIVMMPTRTLKDTLKGTHDRNFGAESGGSTDGH